MRLLTRLPTIGAQPLRGGSGKHLTVVFPAETDVRCVRCRELAAGPMYCIDIDSNAWAHTACAKGTK